MPQNPNENYLPLQPQAATIASAQFMKRTPPPQPSPQSAYAGVGSSVLNLASILNPLPAFDSKSDSRNSIASRSNDAKEHRVGHGFPPASLLATTTAVAKSDNSTRKHGPSPTTTPPLPQTTTLIWQPVETPRDHGGVERPFHHHYHQDQLPSASLPTSSTIQQQQQQQPTTPATTTVVVNGNNTSSPTSSGGFYYYHHYPTPESPKYHQEDASTIATTTRKHSFQDEPHPSATSGAVIPSERASKHYRGNEELPSQNKKQKSKSSPSKKGQLPRTSESEILLMAEPSSSLFTTFPTNSAVVTPATPLPPLQTHSQPSLSTPSSIPSSSSSSTPPPSTTPLPVSSSSTPPATPLSQLPSSAPPTGVDGQTKKVGKKRGRPPKPASEKKKKPPADPAAKKVTAAAKKARKTQEAPKKEEKRYCTCQRVFISPMFMIPCSECQNWFHGACVGLTFSEAAFLDLYVCAGCVSATGKTSTQRPVCARPTCTNPSNITTWGATRSKYCSVECGLQTARDRLNTTMCHHQQDTEDRSNAAKDIDGLLGPKRAQMGRELDVKQNQRDRKHIQKIKRNASKLKAEAKLVDRKLKLLEQILACESTAAANGTGMDACGFDSRLTWQDHVVKAIQRIYATEEGTMVAIDFELNVPSSDVAYTVCDRPRKCPVHEKWRDEKRAELACERRLYLEKIASYDRNLKHLRYRIHHRLHKADGWEFLENGTIQHNTTTD